MNLVNLELPHRPRLPGVVVVAFVVLVAIIIGLVWFGYPRINPQEPPVTGDIPPIAEPVAVTYIAFNIQSDEELELILTKLGGRELASAGQNQLAVSAHLNPLGNVYTESKYPFAVDRSKVRAKLEVLKNYHLPIVLTIFAGKFFTSQVTDSLRSNPDNLMYDQFDKPILLDIVGGTYFAISPSSEGLPRNEYLDIYEKNTKAIIEEVSRFIDQNPGLIIAVSFAGEVKYPPAKEGSGKNVVLRWADYGMFAMSRYRQFLRDKYGDDFEAFLSAAEIPRGTFDSFDKVDPPRGFNRGAGDTLDDPANPNFLIWQEFRIGEVKNHIKQTVQWGREAGLTENNFTKIYSHQAIWEKPESYYWRGSPIETLEIEGINPVVSLYGDKTDDENFIKQVGEIAKNYPGRWGSLQYNPDGPCDKVGNCDPDGYSVGEYFRRLLLVAVNGARVIGVYDDENQHFIRDNFYQAVQKFLID